MTTGHPDMNTEQTLSDMHQRHRYVAVCLALGQVRSEFKSETCIASQRSLPFEWRAYSASRSVFINHWLPSDIKYSHLQQIRKDDVLTVPMLPFQDSATVREMFKGKV